MAIGLLTLSIHISGCTSLKEKRSQIKPYLSRLHKEFNISVAEISRLDSWHEAVISCVLVSNDRVFAQRALQEIVVFTESHFPNLQLQQHSIEII